MPDPTPPVPGAPPPAPAWHNGVEAETLGWWQNKGYDLSDPKTFAVKITQQYREAERHIGAPPDQLLRLPKDANDVEGWKGVYSRLGVPADPKDYDFAGVKFADGRDLEAAFVDTMRAALGQARVPKDHAATVAKAVVKYLDDATAAQSSVSTAKLAEEKAKLAKDWAQNFDFNHLKAMEGARRLGITPEAVKALEGQIGYAAVMDAMRKIGAGTSEDQFVERGAAGGGNVTTRPGAMSRKAELMGDQAWCKRYLSGEVQAKQEMDALNTMIDGEAA